MRILRREKKRGREEMSRKKHATQSRNILSSRAGGRGAISEIPGDFREIKVGSAKGRAEW